MTPKTYSYIDRAGGVVVSPVEAEGQVVDVPLDGGRVGGRDDAGWVGGQVLQKNEQV